MVSARVCTKSFVHILWLFGVFLQLLTEVVGASSTLLPVLENLFLLLSFLVQPHYEGFLPCFIASCFVLAFCCLLDACYFLKRSGEGVDHEKERWLGINRRIGGMKNCGWDVLYKRIIYFRKKIKEFMQWSRNDFIEQPDFYCLPIHHFLSWEHKFWVVTSFLLKFLRDIM